MSRHTLKASAPLEGKGRDITFKTNGEAPGRAHLFLSEIPSSKFLFVFHEWWGLNEHIKNEAYQYFSKLQKVNVICIDLYDGKVAQTREEASNYMKSSDEARIREIITGAIDYAGQNASICTIGWCFGGTWSMQSSMMMNEKAAGCVMYYGMPENDPSKLSEIEFNILGIFASKDQWITPDVVNRFHDQMKSMGKGIEIVNFDADHAFANPSNAQFDEQAGKKAAEISVEFLREMFEMSN